MPITIPQYAVEYTATLSDGTTAYTIELEIDLAALLPLMAERAIRTKTGKSAYMDGMVTARVIDGAAARKKLEEQKEWKRGWLHAVVEGKHQGRAEAIRRGYLFPHTSGYTTTVVEAENAAKARYEAEHPRPLPR